MPLRKKGASLREPVKNYLADFFPLRGWGVPLKSAKGFWAEWFSVKGGRVPCSPLLWKSADYVQWSSWVFEQFPILIFPSTELLTYRNHQRCTSLVRIIIFPQWTRTNSSLVNKLENEFGQHLSFHLKQFSFYCCILCDFKINLSAILDYILR